MLTLVRSASLKLKNSFNWKNIEIVHPVRHLYKRSWAQYKKTKTASELALKYFDQYHQQVYDKQWPSIRLALLSLKKYGALLNNFSSHCEEVEQKLIEQGAKNIMKVATDRHIEYLINSSKHGEQIVKEKCLSRNNMPEEEVSEPFTDSQNVNEFVPATRIYSDDELYAIEQYELSVFKHRDIGVKTIPDEKLTLPNQLKLFCHDKGYVNLFEPPPPDVIGKLGYYLLDAASLLPVIALDIRPGDKVLDLCAAPGGKTLAIVQTLLPSLITANDISETRNKRMLQVMKSYLPDSFHTDNGITITRYDAKLYHRYRAVNEFNRVLVDVPCLTDRHVLHAVDNNLFKAGRISERMSLPQTQCAMLRSGLDMCCVDGTVVYSTCTLAMAQNDGVVEATLEKYHESTDREFAIVDTAVMKQLFHDVFCFYEKSRHGLVVIPSIGANFGPMYVCKLKRLK